MEPITVAFRIAFRNAFRKECAPSATVAKESWRHAKVNANNRATCSIAVARLGSSFGDENRPSLSETRTVGQ